VASQANNYPRRFDSDSMDGVSLPPTSTSSAKRPNSDCADTELQDSPLKRIKTEPLEEDSNVSHVSGVANVSGVEGKEKDPKRSKEPSSPSQDPTKSCKPGSNLPKLDIATAASRAGGAPEHGNTGGDASSSTPLFDTPTTPHPNREAAERAKAEAEQEEREKMQLLVSSFTEDQLDRYAMYRRAALPKATIKKIMQTITGTSVGHNVVIAMAGIAKVFAGEVVEEALKNLEEMGESGQPLRPKHLREAMRKMRAKGAWVPKAKKNCPFT